MTMKLLMMLRYLWLCRQLRRRMTAITETMELDTMSKTYAKYVCRMHGWDIMHDSMLIPHFYEIDFAFVNGYIKALHDNGLEFQNGLVRKRDITQDMPSGALDYYRYDVIRDTKQACRDTLRRVLQRHVDSLTNLNQLMAEYDKDINAIDDE